MTLSQTQTHIASNPRFAPTRQSRPKIQEGHGGFPVGYWLGRSPARNSLHFIDWQGFSSPTDTAAH
jgi:hypothetical protein